MESRVLAYSASVNWFGGPSVLNNSRSCTNHFSEGSVYTGRLTSWRIPQCFMGCYAQSLLIEIARLLGISPIRTEAISIFCRGLQGAWKSSFHSSTILPCPRLHLLWHPHLGHRHSVCFIQKHSKVKQVPCYTGTHQARSLFRDNKVAFQPRTWRKVACLKLYLRISYCPCQEFGAILTWQGSYALVLLALLPESPCRSSSLPSGVSSYRWFPNSCFHLATPQTTSPSGSLPQLSQT